MIPGRKEKEGETAENAHRNHKSNAQKKTYKVISKILIKENKEQKEVPKPELPTQTTAISSPPQ